MNTKDVKNIEMDLAYVLGHTMGDETGAYHKVRLGSIREEWTDYTIVGFGSEITNGSWMLVYEGPFGASKIHSTIMTLYEGWQTSHAVHLIAQAIQCHRKEVLKKKLKE